MARDRGTEEHRYHVIGVRSDGTVAIVGSGLSMEEARRVRQAVTEANIFPAVQIKRGDPQKLGD